MYAKNMSFIFEVPFILDYHIACVLHIAICLEGWAGLKLLIHTTLLQQMPVLLFIVVQHTVEPVSLPTQKP